MSSAMNLPEDLSVIRAVTAPTMLTRMTHRCNRYLLREPNPSKTWVRNAYTYYDTLVN
jgi:hypothetical protein